MKGQLERHEANWRSPLAWILHWPIRLYRVLPRTQDRCRFHPTCSAYGLEALRVHGVVRGGYLTTRRLLRCHPWGGTGIDRVPPRNHASDHEHDYSDGVPHSTVAESEEHLA